MASSDISSAKEMVENKNIPPPNIRRARNIFFAVDHSKHSVTALKWAIKNIINEYDAVTILHVNDFHPVVTTDLYGSLTATEINERLNNQSIKASKELVLQFAKKIVNAFPNIRTHNVLLKGSIRDSICDYVNKNNPDLLLVSSRGMGSVKRWFVGSVSDYCVHNCKCPVLIIKLEEEN